MDLFHALYRGMPGSWAEDGLCLEVGGDWWFPEVGSTPEPAKKVCAMCEVRSECLAFALANDELWGVWGGLTEKERRSLKRRGIRR